ncbi:hypothetical protein PYJP_04130 [Pyrofollis japonicus]|uniref:hypothetical protein n=1 Tax=Pyrofollis japonicus TaxID=3060460 RepID=UPI00295AB6FF|nr:hypothetical protein [Pyrofollis japonicus]BEP17061.1 hypothetical protein PYJP_04130 [Pyrofollis japonicus]
MNRALSLALLALVLALPLLAALPAHADDVKIVVLNTYDFTQLSAYMYNATAGTLQIVNSSYVQVLSDELKDAAAGDNIMPAIVLSLDAPATDLNTGESVVYAYLLNNVYSDGLVVGVADVNSTDNSVSNLQLVKVSPVSGDVAIMRTNYDIIIYVDTVKLSIPLANYSSPKVLLMTDDGANLFASSIQYVELRALQDPPSGYTLIRGGSGEEEFTISASGTLSVWFDETHDGGDVDLFVFDSSNPDYNNASTSQTWGWLITHSTAYLWSDTGPWTRTIDTTGTVKFIVKGYSGDASAVNWRVAVRLLSGNNTPEPQPQQPTETTTQPSNSNRVNENGWLAPLRSAYESNPAAFWLIVILLFVLAVAAVLRR